LALQLLTGPAGAEPSATCLDLLRASLRDSRFGSGLRLLVPTATMAENVRNRMAREGFAFAPDRVATLSKYLEPYTTGVRPISAAALRILIAELLDRRTHPAFAGVVEFAGFRASLAALIEEASTAGCTPEHIREIADTPEQEGFAALYHDVVCEIGARGMVMRAGLLARAASLVRRGGIPDRALAIDGFFSFGALELDLIAAFSAGAEDVTVTLPPWSGSTGSHQRLLEIGFTERLCRTPGGHSAPAVLLQAATSDGEAEGIARRILAEAAGGRRFEDIGIVLRSAGPQVEALRTALERFGIPARFYFTEKVGSHPVVRFLGAVIEAMLGGWRHTDALAALRMNASGIGGTAVGDQLDFALRERLPGQGLETLAGLLPPAVHAAFEFVERWRPLRRPAPEWAHSMGGELAGLFPRGVIEPGSALTAEIWRSHAAALEAWRDALEETAAALSSDRPLGCAEFWRAARDVVEDSELRVNDHRRNCVHVMDAYEARQWRLPVVFAAGLLERQFPRYHPQNPILPDSARLALRHHGVDLRTSGDRRHEERFLFDLATTRATERLFLSYPRFNAAGEENLPSFYLRGFAAAAEPVRRVRPVPGRAPAAPRRVALTAPDLLEFLTLRHRRLGPTSLEKFLECPFHFFVEKTLKLVGPPDHPAERLDNLLSGTIVHKVMAALDADPDQPLGPLVERVFSEACRGAHVPQGFRTEMVRLHMLRDLACALPSVPRPGGFQASGFHDFSLPLIEGFSVTGQMDRCDVDRSGRALVIDYKYSANASSYRAGSENGTKIQAGLYMAAARHLGLEPAGMLFVALRDGLEVAGWQAGIGDLGKGVEDCLPKVLDERIEQARTLAVEAIGGLREGVIHPAPGSNKDCRFCDAVDVCRREARMPRVAAGGGGGGGQ
jgi:ATP-dependent helicase/DNAse subunit B